MIAKKMWCDRCKVEIGKDQEQMNISWYPDTLDLCADCMRDMHKWIKEGPK